MSTPTRTPWSGPNSDPLGDLLAAKNFINNDHGDEASINKIQAFFGGFEPDPMPLPVTASDRVVYLSIEVPTCCKPDQEESVAKEVARALHYSIGGGVRVFWEALDDCSVDVTFAASAHRDHAVSPQP